MRNFFERSPGPADLDQMIRHSGVVFAGSGPGPSGLPSVVLIPGLEYADLVAAVEGAWTKNARRADLRRVGLVRRSPNDENIELVEVDLVRAIVSQHFDLTGEALSRVLAWSGDMGGAPVVRREILEVQIRGPMGKR